MSAPRPAAVDLSPESLAGIRSDTERHLRNRTGCHSCARNVLALLDEVTTLRAAVERVGALADELANPDATLITPADRAVRRSVGRELRAALEPTP